jgi:C4-type Zn-finger protein
MNSTVVGILERKRDVLMRNIRWASADLKKIEDERREIQRTIVTTTDEVYAINKTLGECNVTTNKRNGT